MKSTYNHSPSNDATPASERRRRRGVGIPAVVCAAAFGLLRALAAQPAVTVVQTSPIVLSWPTNLPSFALQTTTNLSTNVAWQNWVAAPAVLGTNYVITNGFAEPTWVTTPGVLGTNFVLTNGFSEPCRFFRASNWPQINCIYNLKRIGLAMYAYATDYEGKYPFQVSTNDGGTMELREIGPDGFDTNTYLHLQVLSNILGQTGYLVCPGDFGRFAASSFQSLGPQNVTYRLQTGDMVTQQNPEQVMAVCPIDGNTLFVSGAVSNVNY